jgi:hypothetical protein
MFDDLNEDNILLFSIKAYNSPHCIMSEFESDFKRIKYIKRLIRKYKVKKILKDRMLLNHIILFYNVFESESATRILFYKVDERDYDILKTFLEYLNYLPEIVKSINGKNILTKDISTDLTIKEYLDLL